MGVQMFGGRFYKCVDESGEIVDVQVISIPVKTTIIYFFFNIQQNPEQLSAKDLQYMHFLWYIIYYFFCIYGSYTLKI